ASIDLVAMPQSNHRGPDRHRDVGGRAPSRGANFGERDLAVALTADQHHLIVLLGFRYRRKIDAHVFQCRPSEQWRTATANQHLGTVTESAAIDLAERDYAKARDTGQIERRMFGSEISGHRADLEHAAAERTDDRTIRRVAKQELTWVHRVQLHAGQTRERL